MTVTPETETRAGLAPQLPQPSVKSSLMDKPRLCDSPRYPSLPGNLDITSGLAETQKHLSDPVLPVIWRTVAKTGSLRQFKSSNSALLTDIWKEVHDQSEIQLSVDIWTAGNVSKPDSELKPFPFLCSDTVTLMVITTGLSYLFKGQLSLTLGVFNYYFFFCTSCIFTSFVRSWFSKVCECQPPSCHVGRFLFAGAQVCSQFGFLHKQQQRGWTVGSDGDSKILFSLDSGFHL